MTISELSGSWVGAAVLFAAVGCGGSTASTPAGAPTSAPGAFARAGVTETLRYGAPFSRETYEDDGDTLVCRMTVADRAVTERLSRSRRTVSIEEGGATRTVRIPENTIALENGCWQQYVVAAEWYARASSPTDVSFLVPSQDQTVDAKIAVSRAKSGERFVDVSVEGLSVMVAIAADGAVSSAHIAKQGLAVHGHARDSKPEQVSVRSKPTADEAPVLSEEPIEVLRAGVAIRGVLDVPTGVAKPMPVLLVVAGSGTTDRDGNGSVGFRTDMYKQLASALATKGIATLRYDKRGVGQSDAVRAESTTIGDFVEDARALFHKLKADSRFSSVGVLGHSEGGLLGLMMAQTTPVDELILLASAGRSFATLVREQLSTKVDPKTLQECDRLFAAVRTHAPLDHVPPALEPIFQPSLAPLLASVIDVDPTTLIKTAKAERVAVIQGDTDAQARVDEDARRLAAADPRAKLSVLHRVAHTLKYEDRRELPQPSYTDPSRPIAQEVVDAVVSAVTPAR